MKKNIYLLFLLPLLVGCGKGGVTTENKPTEESLNTTARPAERGDASVSSGASAIPACTFGARGNQVGRFREKFITLPPAKKALVLSAGGADIENRETDLSVQTDRSAFALVAPRGIEPLISP